MTQFTKINFTKKDLKRIHPAHLSYILGAAHAANELNAIRIYLIFEHREIADKPVEYAFVMIRQMVLLRHSNAKIFEFNLLTTKYFGEIRKIFPSFAEKWRKQYLEIAKEIRSSLWLPQLRNKLAFHFSKDDYLAGFNRINDEQPLSLVYGSRAGETAFTFAEQIVSAPMFSTVGEGDIRRGISKCANFSNEVSRKILQFVVSHQIEVFSNYGIYHDREILEANTSSYGTYDEDFIPIFTTENLQLKTLD